jgi:hypothetical protein
MHSSLHRPLALVAVVLWIGCGQQVWAGTGDGDRVNALGRWAEGPCLAVARSGDLAFCGNGAYLEIVDVSDPTSPVEIGRALLPSVPNALAFRDNVVYIGTDADGVHVVDITNPAQPVLIGELGGTEVRSLVVDGTRLYAHIDGVTIFDVSIAASPVELANLPMTVEGLAATADRLYVAAANEGLRIVDVSNPSAPSELGNSDLGSAVFSVAASGDYAYVTTWQEMHVIDVSNPSQPDPIGTLTGVGADLTVDLVGDRAYLAAIGRLTIADISNPEVPGLTATLYLGNSNPDLTVDGDLACLASYAEGLALIDVSIPSSPTVMAHFATDGPSQAIALHDDHAYVGTSQSGLRILDVADPGMPVVLGYLGINSGNPQSVALDWPHAFVAASGAGLRIIDVTDATSPVEVAAVPGVAADVEMVGSQIYVATADGLEILDVSSPSAPVAIGNLDLGISMRSVTVREGLAYLISLDHAAVDYTLRIVDVSTPAAPVVLGVFPRVDAGEFLYMTELLDDYAFLITTSGLRVIDVSDPSSPEQVGFVTIPGYPTNIAIADGHALIGGIARGLRIFDVAVPTQPVEVGYFDTGGAAGDLAIWSNRVFVADSQDGIWILEVEDVNPVLLSRCEAVRRDDQVVFRWDVTFESDVAGFHVHRREVGGHPVQLTGNLLPGGRRSYEFVDPAPPAGEADYLLEEVARDGRRAWVGSAHLTAAQPAPTTASRPRLARPVPNPFRAPGELGFELPTAAHISLSICDAGGRRLRTLRDGTEGAGLHVLRWDGRDASGAAVPAGIYFVQLVAGGDTQTRKIVLMP